MERHSIKLLLYIFSMLLVFNSSRAQVIYLEDVDFATLKNQARLTGKHILLVCCTEWCGPCKTIKNEHFRDNLISEFINKRYVVGYYDMEKGTGLTIAKKYGVLQYPTLIALHTEGQFRHRIEGAFAEIKHFMTALSNLDSLQDGLYPGISTSIDLPFPGFYNSWFASRKKEKVTANTVNAYLDKQKDLFSEVNWRIMLTLDHGQKFDSLILNNYGKYVQLFNVEARLKVNKILNKMLMEVINSQDLARLEQIIHFMKENNFSEDRILEKKLSFYGKTGLDWNLYHDLLNEYMVKYNGTFLDFCLDVLKKPFPAKLGHTFMYWIDERLKNHSSPWLYIYKGLLLEADQQKSEAELMYRKAVEGVAESHKEIYLNSIKAMQKELHKK